MKDSEKLEKISELLQKLSNELHILDIKVNVLDKIEYLKRVRLLQKLVEEAKEVLK